MNYLMLIDLAKADRDVAILSRHWVEYDLANGSLCLLKNDLHMNRRYSIVCHKNKYLTESAKKFIDVCRNTA